MTANVVTFNGSNVFASPVAASYSTPFANGWAKLVPFQYPTGEVHQLTSTDTPPMRLFGLPMIGFMVNRHVNGAVTVSGGKVLSNYGATAAHKLVKRIQ